MRPAKFMLVLVLLSSVGLYQSCKESGPEYDRVLLAQQLVEHVILPNHLELQDAANLLFLQSQTFRSDPSLANFQQFRQQWLTTKLAFKRVEIFNVGEVYDSYVHSKMNKWPCNPAFIDQMLADVVLLDQPYVDSKGSTAKGLPALEYLLFDPSLNETETFGQLMSSSDLARRLALMEAYAEDIYFKAYFLNDLWTASGDNYGEAFATSSATSGLQSPINLMANAMVAQAERIYGSDLGQPLGNYNGGTPDASLAEAFRSKESLQCIRASIVSIKQTFNGSATSLSTSACIKDHLIHSDAASTANALDAHLTVALTLIDSYPVTLEAGIVTSPQLLLDVREQLRQVVVVLKTEAFPTLGITLTFSDNDGD